MSNFFSLTAKIGLGNLVLTLLIMTGVYLVLPEPITIAVTGEKEPDRFQVAVSEEFGSTSEVGSHGVDINSSSNDGDIDKFEVDSEGAVDGEGRFLTLKKDFKYNDKVIEKSGSEYSFVTRHDIKEKLVISDEFSFTTKDRPTPPPPEKVLAISDEFSFTTKDRPTPPPRPPRPRPPSRPRPPELPVVDRPEPEDPEPEPEPIDMDAECGPYLLEYLRYCSPDNNPSEVEKLQIFLRYFEGFDIPISRIYDEATHRAVQEFQLRYADDILEPWGITEPTDYVFITTTIKINKLFCGDQSPTILDLRDFYAHRLTGLSYLSIDRRFEDPTIVAEPDIDLEDYEEEEVVAEEELEEMEETATSTVPEVFRTERSQIDKISGFLGFLNGRLTGCGWCIWVIILLLIIILLLFGYQIRMKRKMADLQKKTELQSSLLAATQPEEDGKEDRSGSNDQFEGQQIRKNGAEQSDDKEHFSDSEVNQDNSGQEESSGQHFADSPSKELSSEKDQVIELPESRSDQGRKSG